MDVDYDEDDSKSLRDSELGDPGSLSCPSFARSTRGGGCRQLNHSEIEKRRRDKMNSYIIELAHMIPMCHDINRKLDKLTVLRMAVQHLKSLGGGDKHTELSHLPVYITDDEVKQLILQASDGFTFAISCDTGTILFVSESIQSILNYKQSNFIGQSLFDYIYNNDMGKVKEQLVATECIQKDRYIDAKTMKLVKTICSNNQSQLRSGGRRLFMCRMKRNVISKDHEFKLPSKIAPFGKKFKEETDSCRQQRKKMKTLAEKNSYVTVLCTGYIKMWVPSNKPLSEQVGQEVTDTAEDGMAMNLNSLIAVAIPLNGNSNCSSEVGQMHSNNQSSVYSLSKIAESEVRSTNVEFMSRHSADGKFVSVDHRVTSILGYLPQELIGTSIYEYISKGTIKNFADIHKQVLRTSDKLAIPSYKIQAKDNQYTMLKSTIFVFHNPWTKDREHLILNHQVIPKQSLSSSNLDEQDNFLPSQELLSSAEQSSGINITNKDIGRQILDEVCRQNTNGTVADSSTMGGGGQAHGICPSTISNSACICQGSSSGTGIDTTDEAAMTMIMNLIEADAGLGGQVDFLMI